MIMLWMSEMWLFEKHVEYKHGTTHVDGCGKISVDR